MSTLIICYHWLKQDCIPPHLHHRTNYSPAFPISLSPILRLKLQACNHHCYCRYCCKSFWAILNSEWTSLIGDFQPPKTFGVLWHPTMESIIFVLARSSTTFSTIPTSLSVFPPPCTCYAQSAGLASKRKASMFTWEERPTWLYDPHDATRPMI